MKDIVFEKYEILSELFTHMEHNQILAVTALALEKMWTPFEEGLNKSGYTKEEVSEVLQITQQWLKMIWQRVKRGKSCSSDWDNYTKMCERMDEIIEDTDTYGAELIGQSLYFSVEVQDCANYFFCDNDFDAERCADTVSRALDMVVGQVEDSLCNVYPDLKMKDVQRYETVLINHPMIHDELNRIDMDIELVKLYPQSLDAIIERGIEYHKLNLWDIQSPEVYGIHIEIG